MKRYCITTFGCAQNEADSQRIARIYEDRGYTPAHSAREANAVIINTCMVKETAENRVYGLVNNLKTIKEAKLKKGEEYKIIVTGCMVGAALRDKSGKYFKKIRNALPVVDEFLPIEEVGFDMQPLRTSTTCALVPISNGCNNFCTFCIVPFTRGREMSRPYHDILAECQALKDQGYTHVTLLGQNVNSYGADLVLGDGNVQVMRDLTITYFEAQEGPKSIIINGKELAPIYVKHLGRQRIPTLFPYLLEDVAKLGFTEVSFMSSNPWDVTDELIQVIAKNANISRKIHLPVQHGNNAVLKRMNRWYTREEYLALVANMRSAIPGLQLTTDIITGFCGETDEEHADTVSLAQEVGFVQAFISPYSGRPLTAATKVMQDNVPHAVKKARWLELDDLINWEFKKHRYT